MPVRAQDAAAVRPGLTAEIGEDTARLLDDHLQGGEIPEVHLRLGGDVDRALRDQDV